MENYPRKLIWKIPFMLALLIGMGNVIMIIFLPVNEYSWRIFLYASLNSVLIGGTFMFVLSAIVRYLDRILPWLQFPLKRLIYQFVLTTFFSLAVIVLAILFNGYFTRQELTSAYFIESGLFMVKIGFTFIIIGALISNAILFFKNWKESAVQQEKLKREQLALQYETLKSQVNPHFLFNNLNSLTSLISSNPDKAIDFVKKLSEVYRYVLDQKDHELVSLETELKFLESYVFLQKIRFGSNLDVQVEVESGNFMVIPLSVQMLVENAIKHNEISDKNPLMIRVFSSGNGYLTVENKLQKKSGSEGSGSGIQNIKGRYEFFTDKDVTIGITSERFRVSIPLLTD
ncbi:MAG: histidine kinase [Prolixibacteraceae bacterium]